MKNSKHSMKFDIILSISQLFFIADIFYLGANRLQLGANLPRAKDLGG